MNFNVDFVSITISVIFSSICIVLFVRKIDAYYHSRGISSVLLSLALFLMSLVMLFLSLFIMNQIVHGIFQGIFAFLGAFGVAILQTATRRKIYDQDGNDDEYV